MHEISIFCDILSRIVACSRFPFTQYWFTSKVRNKSKRLYCMSMIAISTKLYSDTMDDKYYTSCIILLQYYTYSNYKLFTSYESDYWLLLWLYFRNPNFQSSCIHDTPLSSLICMRMHAYYSHNNYMHYSPTLAIL